MWPDAARHTACAPALIDIHPSIVLDGVLRLLARCMLPPVPVPILHCLALRWVAGWCSSCVAACSPLCSWRSCRQHQAHAARTCGRWAPVACSGMHACMHGDGPFPSLLFPSTPSLSAHASSASKHHAICVDGCDERGTYEGHCQSGQLQTIHACVRCGPTTCTLCVACRQWCRLRAARWARACAQLAAAPC